MPELPDITVYVERLTARLVDQTLHRLRIASPFVLRTVEPSPTELHGKTFVDISRLGKRLVLHLEDELFVVIHLMIAGRLKWRKSGAKIPKKLGLAAFDLPQGVLLLTEASKKKRTSIHIVRGEASLEPFRRDGVDVTAVSLAEFDKALKTKNRTVKRALTDPSIIDGIGNAYSDEILHQAKMSPFKQTQKLTDEQVAGLYTVAREQLALWTSRLRQEVGDGFPEKVTAFREDMAVHGKYQQPCPACGTKVARVRYSENELNYCPRCQTDGRLLSDRSLARLLKDSWPDSVDD